MDVQYCFLCREQSSLEPIGVSVIIFFSPDEASKFSGIYLISGILILIILKP